jgi:type I restriction enzyme S subunit
MGELQEYRLDEIAEVIDCEHKTAPRVERSAFYSVRTPDILNGRIDYANCYRVDEPTYKLWTRRGKPEAGDIILAREAPVGEVGLIQPGYNVCLGQRTVLIKVNREVVDSSYLTFHLCAPPIKTELKEQSGGSVVSHLNMKDIRAFRLSLPDLPEQRAIASVLSSLDAKIYLLHRQNKTLEGMAETLFRQWFVEEAEEEAGEGTLADVAVNIRDGVPVNAFNADDRYVALEHIDRRCIALQQFGSSADVASNKYRFGVNDILFGKLRPYFHKVCLTSFAGICSTDILVIRPKRPELLYYCLFAFFQDEVVEYANAGSGGTRMPRTSWSDLSQYPIALPGKEKLEALNKVVKPMMDKLQANIPQIRSLTALRDTLLPKLMSGELRVEETDRQ